jgi:hypothetical protein
MDELNYCKIISFLIEIAILKGELLNIPFFFSKVVIIHITSMSQQHRTYLEKEDIHVLLQNQFEKKTTLKQKCLATFLIIFFQLIQ